MPVLRFCKYFSDELFLSLPLCVVYLCMNELEKKQVCFGSVSFFFFTFSMKNVLTEVVSASVHRGID